MDATQDHRQPRWLPYRPLVPAALAFAVGIALREYAALPRGTGWGAALVAILAFPLARAIGARHVATAALGILLVAAGWMRLDMAAGPLPASHVARFARAQPVLAKVRGTIAREPQGYTMPGLPLSGDSTWLSKPVTRQRFLLDVAEAHVDDRWVAACGRLRVTVFEPERGQGATLQCGDRVVVTGSLRRPRPPTNPGQFDFAAVLRRRGIHAVMGAARDMVHVEARGLGPWPLGLAEHARRAMRDVLSDSLRHRKEAAALLAATLLGERDELDDELEESFRRSGTAHLLAISGLHVGILAWVIWRLTGLAGLGRRTSGLIVLVAVVLYALVTGLTPSVSRAAIVTVALVVAMLGRRQLDPLHATALAALVVLVLRPFDLFQAGFQLSFAAVVGILCVCEELKVALRPVPRLEERLLTLDAMTRWQRTRLWLRRKAVPAVAVSLAAWLGVLPLIAHYFNMFSPVTVLANLLAVPCLVAVVVFGFAHIALASIGSWLGLLPGLAASGATWLLTAVVEGAARVPLGWHHVARPSLGWVVAYYALGLVVVGRRRIGLNGRQAAAIWMAGLLVFLVATAFPPRPDGFEVTALDVEHGNATALRYPDGSTVLCDCGCYGRTDVGRDAAAPALWHWGVRRIDLIVVSHGDVDHINGLPSLIDRFPVGRVVYSPVLPRIEAGQQLLHMLDARGIRHGPARAGDRIVVGDGNRIEVLAPVAWTLDGYGRNQNENSLVVMAEHGGRRVLVPGDIQTIAATVLLRRGAALRADVLMVPHHGCSMANAAEFARAVRPRVAVCSNQADRIVPEVVGAYERAGARVLATCWHGAVTVRIRDGAMEVLPFVDSGR